MKPKSDLNQLIKSLSGTEKAYFRKFASRHYKESSTFLKLFNKMEGKSLNETYSEEDLKNHFRNEKFIRQLPVTKIYLYNNILKSLNLYCTEDNIDIKLSQMINNAVILYQKELYSQALKAVNKAKLIAEKYDKPAKMLDAIYIERQALRINSSLNEVSKELMKNYDDEEKLLHKLKNISEYRRIYDRMVIKATAKGFQTGSEKHKTFKLILASKLLKNYNNAKYYQSKVIFLLMHCFINNLETSYTDAYEYGKKCLELIGDSRENKIIVSYEYLLILQEMMIIAYWLGRIDETQFFYEKLKDEQDGLLKNSPRKIRDFIKIRSLTCKLNINSGLGRTRDNLELIKEMNKITGKIQGPAYRDEVIVTDFISAGVYFALSMFDYSLHHLNRIINSKEFSLREDIQISCRIMNLVLHYELGNMGSLEYYIKSVYRYLRKRKKLNPFELMLFDFLKSSQQVNNEKELVSLFKETRKELRKASEEEPGMLQLIDLDAWLESKILRKPYIDIIDKKDKID